MRVLYVTSPTLTSAQGEAFSIPEIQELMRHGHGVLLVPIYPRGAVLHEEAKTLLTWTRTEPLLSWEIMRAALRILARTPLKALSVLALLRRKSWERW